MLCTSRSSCINVWVHNVHGRHIILRDIPTDTECRKIYDLVATISGVPSHMLTLSNGVKVLQHRQQFHVYLSHATCSHGYNLQCYIKNLGGDSGDELGKAVTIC